MAELDDDLISAYLDEELSENEQDVVRQLVESDPAWARRLAQFQADSQAIRRLPDPDLNEGMRQRVLDYAILDLEAGIERRRVPRFRRRWMLAASVLLPMILTLVFFHNPGSICRLYLKENGLELQARRSVAEQIIKRQKIWHSPKLWGRLDREKTPGINYQVDVEETPNARIRAVVIYDFNGDGQQDRKEVYAPAELDARKGWERFTPPLEKQEGAFQEMNGGTVKVKIVLLNEEFKEFRISRTPGEVILPYKGLRTSKGAFEENTEAEG